MTRDRNKPSAVILDMLRSARSRHRTARSLIGAGELFGFSENTLRVTLSRLLTRGIIESPQRGLYRLARQTDALNDFVERWRLGETRVRRWRPGRWLFAHVLSAHPKAETTASEWALSALGFREVRPALFVRPDNLALKTEELRTLASGIGVDPGVLLVTGQPEGDPAPQSWLQAWQPTRLNEGYVAALHRLDESTRRLPTLDSDQARLECFSLGGEMIHRLAKEPLLPSEFVNVQAREALWRAMLDYDLLGKDIWASGKEEALRRMPRPQLDMAR